MEIIRNHHHLLTESEGGCALWANKEELTRALVVKNTFVYTINIAGLAVGGTTGELWERHKDWAQTVAGEVLAVQEWLTGKKYARDDILKSVGEGIHGDPVQGRKLVDWAKMKGIQLDFQPYGGAPRAFTVNPEPDDLKTMADLLEYTWGSRNLTVLDPFPAAVPFPLSRCAMASPLLPMTSTR